MNWQPIDTAPKDGSTFLGMLEGGYCVIASWCEHGDEPEFLLDYTGDSFSPCVLSHWMPIPPPPGEQGAVVAAGHELPERLRREAHAFELHDPCRGVTVRCRLDVAALHEAADALEQAAGVEVEEQVPGIPAGRADHRRKHAGEP